MKDYIFIQVRLYIYTVSAFHPQTKGKPVVHHTSIHALFIGIYNQRSPQPRYTIM